MTPERRQPDQEIDDLVRAYLRTIEGTVDAPCIMGRVAAEVGGTSPAANTRFPDSVVEAPPAPVARRRWRWGLGLASAASVLAGCLLLLEIGRAQASPEAFLREAQQALTLSTDRCYLMQVTLPPEVRDDFPWLGANAKVLLWARKDQYWMWPADPERQWRCGRDEKGRGWMVLTPRLGLRYDAEEVPRGLTIAGDVCGLQVEALLNDVLTDFDTRWEQNGPNSRTVRAVLKPGRTHPTLREVTLEIDPETKVVRRAVMTRLFRLSPTVQAGVVATLVESGTQTDSRYQLEGHLQPDAQILGSDQAEKRRAILGLLRERRGRP